MLASLPEQRARLAIGVGVGLKMHAVGAQALGELGIVLDEASSAGALHKVDQAGKAIFVARALVAPEQNAGDIGFAQALARVELRALPWARLEAASRAGT